MGICVSCRRRERKAPEKRTVPGAGGPARGAAAAELLPRRGDRLPMMANSMPNYKMTNPIKGIVSKRRRRYMKDGFNLDLAYITDRLIAMGFPAEKLEGVYRNHIDEVYRFLEKKHKDHYKIYNLCSERSYDSSKFHERVVKYAFEDHTPPNIEMIQPFCEDVDKWLCEDSRNVAAVHCKAGKGRTGTMVCCYLLYSRQKTTADEALKFYGTKRTHDEKGVTIPSQRRYVEYYAWLLRSGLSYAPTKVHIRELLMTPPPFQHGHATPELLITQARPFFKAPTGCHEVRRTDTSLHVRLEHCTPLCGDVRVDVYKHKMKMRKEKLFHFWFNTFFVAAGAGAVPHPPLPDSPNLETFKLTLNKWQLDDAHKDKQHKAYSQDFKVELIVQKMPSTCTLVAAGASSPPSSTASSVSSGSEPEPDAHWDSGEPFPYTRLTSPDLQTQPQHTKDIHDPQRFECTERLQRFQNNRLTSPDLQTQPQHTKDIHDPQRFERNERLQRFQNNRLTSPDLQTQPQDHKDIHDPQRFECKERLQRFQHNRLTSPDLQTQPQHTKDIHDPQRFECKERLQRFQNNRLTSPDLQTQPQDTKDIHDPQRFERKERLQRFQNNRLTSPDLQTQPQDTKDIHDPQRFECKERLQRFQNKTSPDTLPQDQERLQRFQHEEIPSKCGYHTDGFESAFDKGIGPSKLSVYPDGFEYKNVEGIGSKSVSDGFGPKQSDYGKPADGFQQDYKEGIGPSNSAYGEFGPSKQSDYGPDNFQSDLHHKADGRFEYPESVLERLCEPTEYAKRKNSAPTVNPLYCSKADEKKYEAMEYGSDVFASAPTSARESPVEDKKRTEDRSKPRLSLDIRASWREFSGKFASDRRVKDES